MCFVAEVGDDVDLVFGGKPREKQRLRGVFENGTESAMYKQSLMTRLYEAQGHVPECILSAPGQVTDCTFLPAQGDTMIADPYDERE